MFLGYASPEPTNERTLATIIAASRKPLASAHGPPHLHAVVAGPTLSRLVSGALVGVAGRGITRK